MVAVTGPTGTFGFGLMPLLEADERVAHVVGIARRPTAACPRLAHLLRGEDLHRFGHRLAV
jgi:hypothetical protein